MISLCFGNCRCPTGSPCVANQRGVSFRVSRFAGAWGTSGSARGHRRREEYSSRPRREAAAASVGRPPPSAGYPAEIQDANLYLQDALPFPAPDREIQCEVFPEVPRQQEVVPDEFPGDIPHLANPLPVVEKITDPVRRSLRGVHQESGVVVDDL